MQLTKLNQSGIILESDSGFRLAIDVGSFTALDEISDISVDAALVSHIHGDHFSVPHIRALRPTTVYLNQECIDAVGEESLDMDICQIADGEIYSIGDFEVFVFNVDHGPNVSSPLAENFGFLISADGQKLYFAGDMYYPSGMNVEHVEVDFALLPVGGHYTFGPSEALDFARTFKSIETLVPIHYDIRPEALGEFVELVGEEYNLG
jgi:L-ascorbate metabolism protein UlaG (beta-lactamase superfamily)